METDTPKVFKSLGYPFLDQKPVCTAYWLLIPVCAELEGRLARGLCFKCSRKLVKSAGPFSR